MDTVTPPPASSSSVPAVPIAPGGPHLPVARPAVSGAGALERQVHRAHEAVRALAQVQLPPQAENQTHWSLAQRLASVDRLFGEWNGASEEKPPSDKK